MFIRKQFNVVVMRTALELRGVACIGPEEDRTGKKDQLIVSRSFSEKVTTVNGIRQALSIYAQQMGGSRLTRHQQVGKTLIAFAGTAHFAEQKHYPQVKVRLPFPTADPVELTKAAHTLLPPGSGRHPVRPRGLMMVDLLPAGIHLPLEPFRATHEDAGSRASSTPCRRRPARTRSARVGGRHETRAGLADEAGDADETGDHALGRARHRPRVTLSAGAVPAGPEDRRGDPEGLLVVRVADPLHGGPCLVQRTLLPADQSGLSAAGDVHEPEATGRQFGMTNSVGVVASGLTPERTWTMPQRSTTRREARDRGSSRSCGRR